MCTQEKRDEPRLASPEAQREGAAAIPIRYAIGECFLGWFLVAVTDRGICAIEIGDDPKALPRQLQGRFPKALLQDAGAALGDLLTQVMVFVNHPRDNVEMVLDIQGSPFQRRVWSVLQQSKVGQTLTYTELAHKTGNPAAIRAVATACASNKIAILIPCHRVLAKGGKISGYRWGVKNKKMLLAKEGAVGQG